MDFRTTIRKLQKKMRKVSLVGFIRRISHKRLRCYLLTRLYYYFNWAPWEMMLDISSACNARCPFCPRTLLKIQGIHMRPEIFYKVVEEAAALGVRNYRLYSTGEPLLHPHVDDFIRYLKKKNFSIMLSTNGQFIDNHMEALSLLDEIKISIEGWDKESYEYYRPGCHFQKLQDNLVEFRKFIAHKIEKPVMTIGLMIFKETNIKKFYEAWRDKCDQIVTWPTGLVFDWDEAERIKYIDFQDEHIKSNVYKYVFAYEKVKYCGYPFSLMVVTAKGNYVICCCDYHDNIVYGNVQEKLLSEVIRDPRRKKVQQQFLRGQLDLCRNCQLFFKPDEVCQKDYEEKLRNIPER